MASRARQDARKSPARGTRLVVLIGLLGVGCASGSVRYAARPTVWRDADQRPFAARPGEYYSPFFWDAADQTFFRPVTRFFAVDPAGPSANVNALDEVPDSSWFENRIGRFPMSPLDVARGPCAGYPPPNPKSVWWIESGKPNGENPGFVASVDGVRYVVKLDESLQGPRAAAADIIGSRLYHAAGYFVPCNRVVYLRRSALRIGPRATVEDDQGHPLPMVEADLDTILDVALELRDGRYRAMASRYLPGKPLGPWRYQNTRSDDLNDVIPHQDRRELRGMRLLASWINHFDSREQNTLDMWLAHGGRGFVRHHLVDFGDSLGSLWTPPTLGRRIGQSYYVDFGDMAQDWFTFGAIERPWDRATFGPSGPVFGYFDVEHFDPETWKPGYPNPAFGRMKERDAAWMARIIAQFTDEHVRAIVRTADLRDPLLNETLFRILVGRRDKILRRYLGRLSPLAWPELRRSERGTELCMKDLLVASSLARPEARTYAVERWYPPSPVRTPLDAAPTRPDGTVCALLAGPSAATRARSTYLIVDFAAPHDTAAPQPPARVHLYELGAGQYRIAGLERPRG
jgi:hypothetical protein